MQLRKALPLAAAIAGAAVLALVVAPTPSIFGQGRLIPVEEAATAGLEGELFPPEEVFVQKTTQFPGFGNVLVSVQLNDAQLEAKKERGNLDFITIGEGAGTVILRDDGRGADEKAGDGLFTGLATVDEAQLAERAQEDQEAVAEKLRSESFAFAGRTFAGAEAAEPFDFQAFQAGARVELGQAVVVLDEEEKKTSGPEAEPAGSFGDAVPGAKGAALTPGRAVAASTAPQNCTSVPTPSPGMTSTFQNRALMIRNPLVVADSTRTLDACTNAGNPDGVWTFKHLMTEMANPALTGIDPRDFVEQFLLTWSQNPAPTINGHTVSTRTQIDQLIADWRSDSGGGKLDLDIAPMRLIAIVPRVDLRRTEGGGGGYNANVSGKFLDAGELRFVFGVMVKSHWDESGYIDPFDLDGPGGSDCRALPFTIILEYRVPACDCPSVRDWAQGWVKLAKLVPGTSAYAEHLESLTEAVVAADANPIKPNGSAIGQVRTNEVALPQDAPTQTVVWELREFQLTQQPWSFLEETTANDTPQDVFNGVHPSFGGSPLLKNWIVNEVQAALAANNDCQAPIPTVPLFFQGQPFLGANPQVPDPPQNINYHWDHPGLSYAYPFENWARHRVSLAACSGCHRRETLTDFTQIENRANLPVPIAGFLSGINDVSDPAAPNNFPDRHFDDLLRREDDVRKVARMRCFRFHPVNFAHVRAELAKSGTLPDDLFAGLEPLPATSQVSISPDDMQRNAISEPH